MKPAYAFSPVESPLGRIPPVMHFVWLGPNGLSEADQRNVDAFQALHPHWKVKVWRDIDVARLPITGHLCQNIRPMAVAADIARVEIIFGEGGWYSDTDVRWLKSIDYLNDLPAVLSSETDRRSSSFSNGIFAAAAKNPLLEIILKRLSSLTAGTIAPNDVLNETGPRMWSRAFRNYQPQARLHHSYNDALGGLVVDCETCEVVAHHNLSFRWK